MNRIVMVLAMTLALAACGQRPDPRLYVMSPVPDSTDTAGRVGDPVKAVLRVRFPDYLDRPQIVSRSGANALEINDDDRWGEPLDESLPRVLAENLSHYLPGARVVVPAEASGHDAPYEYMVSLDAYEPDGRGNVVMRGRWHLRDERRNKVVAEGRIDEHRPLASSAASEVVAAMNGSLDEASRQIADATKAAVIR
jgi:uncharacterized lipoprotein YmbA